MIEIFLLTSLAKNSFILQTQQRQLQWNLPCIDAIIHIVGYDNIQNFTAENIRSEIQWKNGSFTVTLFGFGSLKVMPRQTNQQSLHTFGSVDTQGKQYI